jgi:hypothetical protein
MSAPDRLIDAYAVGLDLVPVQMAVTTAGAAIGLPPLAGLIQSQSVILYCKRYRNIKRLMAVIRSEFANEPTRATLPGLVSAVLKLAGELGVTILTETEVQIAAAETIAQMEAELGQLQSTGGLPAINRSLQNDAVAAEAAVPLWHRTILSWLHGGRTGCWRDRVATLHRVSVAALTASVAIIKTQWANIVRQLGDCFFNWAGHGEHLTIRLLRHLSIALGHAARRMAHRRRLYGR